MSYSKWFTCSHFKVKCSHSNLDIYIPSLIIYILEVIHNITKVNGAVLPCILPAHVVQVTVTEG